MGVRRHDVDAIRVSDFSRQLLDGLVASSMGVATLDQWFRFQYVNEALATMNRIPAKDHLGEHVRKIAGEVALQSELAFHAVLESGKVISGFEIIGKLPKRPDVGHWKETYFPIRDARGNVKQVGVLVVEIGSHSQSKQAGSGGSKQLIERVSLNTKLLRQLLRQHGEHSTLRANVHRIVDCIGEEASNRAPSPEHRSVALSEREREVVSFLANGKSNKDIASMLNISVKTVECYRARVFLKLRLDSFAGLVRYAIRNKLVEP